MISLKLSLDQRRQRNDGTYPITIRISHKGKSRSISTGFTCKLSEWDFKYNCLKNNSDSLRIQSNRLNEQRMKYQERLIEFERNHLDPTTDIQSIKDYLSGKISSHMMVYEFWQEMITTLENSKRYGNARAYKSALCGVKKVMSLNKQFSQIDYAWLVQLDSKLRANGVKTNSVAVYMRALRALYNKAINFGIVDQANYPFRKYKIKSGKTTPRVASIEELQRFFTFKPESRSSHYDHWNYGRLIFMLRGINFTDLALLTKDNIKHGRIVYRRSKTHKIYSIAILPEVQAILDEYSNDERVTLLPILSNEENTDRSCHPKRLGQLRKTTNKWLRRIGLKVETEESLSTYVFRYSFANACKKLGYSKDLIAEALGHEYGNSITGIYLEQFDMELVDEMNEHVYREVTGGN